MFQVSDLRTLRKTQAPQAKPAPGMPSKGINDRLGFLQRNLGNGLLSVSPNWPALGQGVQPAKALPIQAKLMVGPTDDHYEQEADRVADQIMNLQSPPALVKSSGPTLLQAKCAACEEEEEQKKEVGVVRRDAAENLGNEHPFDAPPIVHEALSLPGQPLDQPTRAFFEPRFNQDFSRVRIHSDPKAAQSAQSIHALAYTVGQDIVFGAGKFEPTGSEGRRLLAHELTHIVQQNPRVQPAGDSPAGSAPLVNRQSVQSLIQRDNPPGAAALPALPVLPSINLPIQWADLGADEAITPTNPKLIQLAQAYKSLVSSNPMALMDAHVDISGYLTEASNLSSDKQKEERAGMLGRMKALQNTLDGLGVPASKISIDAPYGTSSTSGGVVTAKLYKDRGTLLSPIGPVPVPGLRPVPTPGALPAQGQTPAATPGLPSLGDKLSFKFKAGLVEFALELPKSLTVKLPAKLSPAKELVFELKAETSGTFSFSITYNGLPHIRVGAKSSLNVSKDQGTSGSAGLEIQLTSTVCSADNPEVLKAKILESGEKLKKAGAEFKQAPEDKKLEKLFDVASAIGDMYDSVDKSSSSCKQVPSATVNIGVQGPISPSDSAVNAPDPLKRPATFVGGSVKIPF